MDLHNDVKYSRAIAPFRQTNADTAIVSQILDTAAFEQNEVIIHYGNLTDADATIAVLLEDGDNSALSDNAAVADALLKGTEAACAAAAATDDYKICKLGYIGMKRYLRLTVTPTGNNSGNVDICAIWAQSGKKQPQS